MRRLVVSAPLIASVMCSPVYALDLDAISAITDAVTEVCQAPDRKGELLTIEGEGEADVDTIIKVLDFEGAIRIEKKDWDGIADYLEDRPDYRDCVKKITPMFIFGAQERQEDS